MKLTHPITLNSISFLTEDIKFALTKRNALRGWIAATAKKEGFKIEQLNYIFSSDKFLHNLNEHYLHHDDFTDIITFDLSAPNSDLSCIYREPRTAGLSGDIFISIERVKENATLFKSAFQNELHRVMIHAVLHLCGHKDKTKKDKAKMREKENYYLNLRSFL